MTLPVLTGSDEFINRSIERQTGCEIAKIKALSQATEGGVADHLARLSRRAPACRPPVLTSKLSFGTSQVSLPRHGQRGARDREPGLVLLLVLVYVARLAVLVMILATVASHTSEHRREIDLAGERARSIWRQTIDWLFLVGPNEDIDSNGWSYPSR